jgi:hypothetical protein
MVLCSLSEMRAGDMMVALPFTGLIRAKFLDRQMQTIKS